MDMQLSDGADLDACRNAFQKLKVSRRAHAAAVFSRLGTKLGRAGHDGLRVVQLHNKDCLTTAPGAVYQIVNFNFPDASRTPPAPFQARLPRC